MALNSTFNGFQHHLMVAVALIASIAADEGINDEGRQPGSKNIRRKRIPVRQLFRNLGAKYVKKAYRMNVRSFRVLFNHIEPYMKKTKKRKRGKTPNGDIGPCSRLSMALRWFAGGEPIDIMQTHGVGYDEVYTSVWAIVDAINACPKLQIKFPNHQQQQHIAAGFKKKSFVGFDNCVGCIDGMLVWTNKPNKTTLQKCDLGPLKFLCGRKKKFGLNLQAICDHKRKFIDVFIGFPGSASDFLCYCNSSICDKLNAPGFLLPGLCIYGDAAYANNMTMCVPYKSVSNGPKDAYNFYQSQLRINIECAFGILVHRWGVLRKPIPVNISIERTTQLVRALCILHNFCIDEKDTVIPTHMAKDKAYISTESGIIRVRYRVNINNLVGGGHHYNNVPNAIDLNHDNLPRSIMLAFLIKKGIKSRLKPRGLSTTNK